MRIAVTVSEDKGKLSPVEPRFGRTSGFLLCDTETGETEFVSNEQNRNALQGAGIQSAQNVVAAGAQAVISGHCGPKAFQVLAAADIPLYLADASLTAEAALAALEAGSLKKAEDADREGHWV